MGTPEEIFWYCLGRSRAQSDIMWMAYELNKTIDEHDGAEWLIIFRQRINGLISLYIDRKEWISYIRYCECILSYIGINNKIRDYPSFIRYITGWGQENE